MENLTLVEIKKIADEYNLPKYGKKSELIERIKKYKANESMKRIEWESIMKIGETKRDDEFEKVIHSYVKWCENNKFELCVQNQFKFDPVHINVIRAELFKYKPEKSSLRNDSLVPIPKNKLEVFIEMIFSEHGGEWMFFDSTEEDRLFDESSPYNDEWFIDGLKKIYES